jgi:hypothetical protein
MESKEQMESKTKEPSASTKGSTVFVPVYASPPMPKTAALREHIVQRFRAKQYKELAEDLSLYRFNGLKINHYLEKDGPFLLHLALCLSSDPGSLAFLRQNVSLDVLSKLLRMNNYHVLGKFASLQMTLQELEFYDEKTKIANIEKLKLLLEIDSYAVNRLMTHADFKDRVNAEFRANFVAALSTVLTALKPSISNP